MLIVFITVPEGSGAEIAKELIGRAVCACVNVLPAVASFYLEEGEMKTSSEELLLVKVAPADAGILRSAVLELHPYDTPEFVAIEANADHSDEDYLRWVRYATRF
ncbi:MAG: divalent-cation tolerance protein CutA [Proteobacteria bacterium]|nr:divalent-cation tolerance protein CutA [Pseudomonadota bacterium]